jgi:hypothetical protein
MAASALRRKACRFRRSKYPADRLRPRRGRCRGGSHRASANVGMMDTEMPMSTAALVMATVIIEPENLSCLTILLQPTAFNARKNRWRCFFLPRPCEASPTLTLAGGGDGTGLEAIRTLLKRDCLLKMLLPPPSAGWRSQKFSGIDLQHGREFAEDFKPRTEACYASSGRSDFRLRRQLTGQPAGPFAYRALPIANSR